jgi:hypothetical protein
MYIWKSSSINMQLLTRLELGRGSRGGGLYSQNGSAGSFCPPLDPNIPLDHLRQKKYKHTKQSFFFKGVILSPICLIMVWGTTALQHPKKT